jgi:hypothetical protein
MPAASNATATSAGRPGSQRAIGDIRVRLSPMILRGYPTRQLKSSAFAFWTFLYSNEAIFTRRGKQPNAYRLLHRLEVFLYPFGNGCQL